MSQNQALSPSSYNDEALSVSIELANLSDWQTPMMAAPTCIVLIGQCMAMTVGNDDVSLTSCAPPQGFKHLIQPQSLRACMRQLCNATYQTMSNAENKMYAISLAANGIPNHIRTMYESLMLHSPGEKRIVIPQQSTIVQEEAEKCAKWAADICKQFATTTDLLNELLLCCEGKKGATEVEVKQNMMRKGRYEQAITLKSCELQRQQEVIQENLSERQRLQREMEVLSRPTTTENFFNALERVTEVAGKFAGIVLNGTAVIRGVAPPNVELFNSAPSETDPLANMELTEVHTLASKFSKFLELGLEDASCASQAQDLSSLLQGLSSDNSIFEQLAQYPKAVLNYSHSNDINRKERKDQLAQQQKKATHQLEQLKCLIRESKDARSKIAARQQEHRVTQAAAQNRLTKLSINAKILADANAQASLIEQRIAMIKAEQQHMTQKLADIATKCSTMEGAIEMLKRVLVQLNSLQMEWNKLSKFFETTASTMNQASKEVHSVASLMEAVHMNHALSDSLCESIVRGCVTAHGHTKYTHLISSMYVAVSKEYFTEDLSSLPQIMQMTPEEAKAEVERRSHRLALTHSGIERMISLKHSQMVKFMKGHAERGRNEYISIAPPSERKALEKQASEIEAKAEAIAQEVVVERSQEEKEYAQAKIAYTEDAF